MPRTVAAWSVVLLLPLTCAGPRLLAQAWPCPQPEVEPNDTFATATALVTPVFEGYYVGVPGSVSPAGDVDYFRVPAQAGERLWLLVDTGGAQSPGATSRDSLLTLLTPDGGTVLEQDDDDGTGNGHGFTIESEDASVIAGLTVTATGDYLVRVEAKNPANAIAPYVLAVGRPAASLGPEHEPNNTQQTAEFPFAQAVEATLSDPTDVDWYIAAILDNGWPAVFVDGDPERDGVSTEVVLDVDLFRPSLHVDSAHGAGAPPPAAEGVLLPNLAMVRVSGPAAGSYRMFIPYTSLTCPVPVELLSFSVE